MSFDSGGDVDRSQVYWSLSPSCAPKSTKNILLTVHSLAYLINVPTENELPIVSDA